MGKGELSALRSLRQGLHETVFDKVKNVCPVVKELRYPSEKKYDHSGKIIGLLHDMEQGKALKSTLEEKVQQVNEQMKQAAPNFSVTPIKYGIALVRAEGNVMISQTAAQRRIGIKGSDLSEEIKKHLEYLLSQKKLDSAVIQRTKDFLSTIDLNEMYIDAVDTGTNYRASWYDAADGKRHQQSVGHVLIVVGDSTTHLVDTPKRKSRSDQSEMLFGYEKPLPFCPEIVRLHRIYPYDMRYIGRYIGRKKKIG